MKPLREVLHRELPIIAKLNAALFEFCGASIEVSEYKTLLSPGEEMWIKSRWIIRLLRTCFQFLFLLTSCLHFLNCIWAMMHDQVKRRPFRPFSAFVPWWCDYFIFPAFVPWCSDYFISDVLRPTRKCSFRAQLCANYVPEKLGYRAGSLANFLFRLFLLREIFVSA